MQSQMLAHACRFSLPEATRYLLREALEDPLNQRFVLLSESGLPLYPPGVFYQQVPFETASPLYTLPAQPTVVPITQLVGEAGSLPLKTRKLSLVCCTRGRSCTRPAAESTPAAQTRSTAPASTHRGGPAALGP